MSADDQHRHEYALQQSASLQRILSNVDRLIKESNETLQFMQQQKEDYQAFIDDALKYLLSSRATTDSSLPESAVASPSQGDASITFKWPSIT